MRSSQVTTPNSATPNSATTPNSQLQTPKLGVGNWKLGVRLGVGSWVLGVVSCHRRLQHPDASGCRVDLDLTSYGNRELRHAVADHGALPCRDFQWLDVIVEHLFERERPIALARLALT